VSTNFAHLRRYDEQLFRLGVLAERYFPEDPNTALIKLRQLGERLAQQMASRFGVFTSLEETQLALIRRLELDGLIEREVAALFHDLRKNGNAATHGLQGDHASALSTLKIAWQLGVWFHRSFGDPEFRSGPFQPPLPPVDESEALKQELARLQAALDSYRANEGAISEQLSAAEAQLQQALGEQQQWEQLAEQVEADKAALAAQLQDLQNAAAQQPAAVASGLRQASRKATAARNRRPPAEEPQPGHRRMAHQQRPGRLRAVRGAHPHRCRGSQAGPQGCGGRASPGPALLPRLPDL
jgi:type I restriction enzyme R subunit